MSTRTSKNAKKFSHKDQQRLDVAVGHHRAGRAQEALAIYQTLLRKYPRKPEVLHLQGVLSFQLGQFEAARELLAQAVSVAPSVANYRLELARVLRQQGRFQESLGHFQALVKANPQALELLVEQGVLHYQIGDFEQAIACFAQGLRLRPGDAMLRNRIARCHIDLLAWEEARACYEEILQDHPGDLVSRANLALICRITGEFDAGRALFEEALQREPGNGELKSQFAKYLAEISAHKEAVEQFESLLKKDPGNLDLKCSLVKQLVDSREYARALEISEEMLSAGVSPNEARQRGNHGNLLTAVGCCEEALEHFLAAEAAAPGDSLYRSMTLFALNNTLTLSAQEQYQKHLEAGELIRRQAPLLVRKAAVSRDPERRLTVAYLSPDLHRHSVAYFFEPLLKAHDRSAVRVFCYSDSTTRDDVNARLREQADGWRDIAAVSDVGVYRQLCRDQVDILVELAGHTGHNRLKLMAAGAAPVQVTYLGYPNTTGVPAIRYRVTDERADPPGESDALHSEALVRLPGGFLCYQPPGDAPEVVPAPCLARGSVRFGCFNKLDKISETTLQMWAEILRQVPDSRLTLKAKGFSDELIRERFLERCAQADIDPQVVELMGYIQGVGSHLRVYNEIDIGLDTHPYNGATTTCEALWMGVPVVALSGDRHSARVSSSLLHTLGLSELVAPDEAGYVALAVSLAGEPQRLQALRAQMRARMQASTLMDPQRMAGELEAAYRQMWRRYCAEAE